MVAIKDMKMPDNCEHCQFIRESCGLEICALTHLILPIVVAGRDEHCPLVEIGE